MVSGGLQDYGHLFSSCMELTVEVSCCKKPPAGSLARHWRHNWPAMLAVLGAVRGGLAGRVLDPAGRAVAGASLAVAGQDRVNRTSERGEFWRLLRPGRYTLTASLGTAATTLEVEVVRELGEGATTLTIVLDTEEFNNGRHAG